MEDKMLENGEVIEKGVVLMGDGDHNVETIVGV